MISPTEFPVYRTVIQSYNPECISCITCAGCLATPTPDFEMFFSACRFGV